MRWKKVKLGELCKMNSGGTPRRNNPQYYNGTIPWAKIGDIENATEGFIYRTQEYITQDGLNSIGNRIFPVGTLLLAMYGSVGKTAFAGIPISTNQAILGIKVIDETIVNSRYLKHWLDSIKVKLLDRAVGGTLQNISLGIVKDLEVPLPPLHIQEQIADALDKADALRKKDQELLKKYDELSQSIFYDMFGDTIFNSKKWCVVKVSELITFMTSGSRGWATYYSETGDIFLRINNVKYASLLLDDIVYINPPDTAEAKRTVVRPGDVLLSITADLGRSAVVPDNLSKAYINQHLALLRLKNNINPYYLAHFLNSNGGQEQIRKSNKGGVKAGLNFNDIRETCCAIENRVHV